MYCELGLRRKERMLMDKESGKRKERMLER
jgi:hypothetical protein